MAGRFLGGIITGAAASFLTLGGLSQFVGIDRLGGVTPETVAQAAQDSSEGTSPALASSGATTDAQTDDAPEAVQQDELSETATEDASSATVDTQEQVPAQSTQEGVEEETTDPDGDPESQEVEDAVEVAEPSVEPTATLQDIAQAVQPDETPETSESNVAPEPEAETAAPEVSEVSPSVPQPASTPQTPVVVDSSTGDSIAVETTIRPATAPNAPEQDTQTAGSTEPPKLPQVDAPVEEETTDEASVDATQDNVVIDDTQRETAQSDRPLATALPTVNNGVKVNRLPRIGDDAETTETAIEEDATEAEAETEAPLLTPKAPPVQRFATAFKRTDDKPLMSIILMDTGQTLERSDVGLEALDQFGHPVTIAVDTSLPDASERMRALRSEGFEVMAMVDVPTGFTAQDTEVTMSVILEDMTEVIGVLDGPSGGIQSSREISAQMAAILGDAGLGLVTQSSGLNSGSDLAARAGVPAQTIYRDLDAKDQTAIVIRRFLDEAAFRAGQSDEGIVVLGRVRPETISALLLWGLQGRVDNVSIAPVSALLND